LGALVGDGKEATPGVRGDRHLRHDGNPHAGGDHCQDGFELAAFEGHVEPKAGAAAGRERVLPETVVFLHQQEGVPLDLPQVHAGLCCQAMALETIS
jgi:hypothetical protein